MAATPALEKRERRERDFVLLGTGPRKYSSVGIAEVPGAGVDDTLVMVGRPAPCGRNCGCCPPGTRSAERDEVGQLEKCSDKVKCLLQDSHQRWRSQTQRVEVAIETASSHHDAT
ncbi:hypothetical protein C0J52_00417 [Blattella germanica]|nr:hypothetical protein C0J52_00417 [Blattella germanica]